ncbi:MAG: hypothetical protein J4N79_05715 [Chloroflexi bacterium]|nr:hypothetical protein [Chloroflexota bacterium]TDI94428.1 MAG: hypothetical protein E2O75_00180 [Chloroflexota bacterium]
MKAYVKTSFRDLLITGWLIIFGTTVGVVAFHPGFQDQGTSGLLSLGGLAAVSTVGGILLTRFVDRLGQATSRARKIALVLFVASMVALIPVMFVLFVTPWAVLIVITLLYVRWKWALLAAED